MKRKIAVIVLGLFVLAVTGVACASSSETDSTADKLEQKMKPTKGDITPPELTITAPADDTTVTAAELNVNGKTEPNAQLIINNKSVQVNADGTFSGQLTLSPGTNKIKLTAVDASRNETVKFITITYQSGQPPPSMEQQPGQRRD